MYDEYLVRIGLIPRGMMDMSTVITQHPSIMSGAPCFAGTRVPVVTLFDNLSDGATLNQFVELFPGVSLEQIQAVLKEASNEVLRLVR